MGSILSKFVNEEWQKMPWKAWKSPLAQFKVMPSFTVIEWTYRLIAWSLLRHALKTNGLPLWFSAWLCGTANDIFFMFMPFCDNFWQAQGCVMITPRLPLYIVEMYAVIIYISTTAARQFNLPYVSEAALTGLLAHVLYGVYDINGPPNLWWTWHDGDPSISKRQHNAPLGSSMWILTYISLHSLLLRWTENSYARLSSDLKKFLGKVLSVLPSFAGKISEKLKLIPLLDKLQDLQYFLNRGAHNYGHFLGWAFRIGFSGLVCTPMFMSLMGVFQIFSLDTVGIPGSRTYKLTLLTYLALTLRGFLKAHRSGALRLPKQKRTLAANKQLLYSTLFFYLVNLGIGLWSDSTKHTSTGVHQKYSERSSIVKDIMGFRREDNIYGDGPREFSTNDYKLPNPEQDRSPDPSGAPIIYPKNTGLDSEWYTVMGKPRHDKAGDNKLLATFTLIGTIAYSAAFTNLGTLPAYIP
mmetsp:Transcript_1440/g.1611  ORF Transcript_1440/g.1611 Transcript_1440/m.1611 type:complete len:467 (+) Transcript_1440:92-1492(+)